MHDPSSVNANLIPTLGAAIDARAELFDVRHETAFRLFNGFYEGFPQVVADLYGRTLVLHNYASPPLDAADLVNAAARFYLERLPWINTILIKARHAESYDEKLGVIVHGETLDQQVIENGVRYAVDLRINQDTSLYLDTRNLRVWAKENLNGKTVLNTFAYTGSLGVAAKAGGATRVMQVDLSRSFLNVAKDSYVRNGFAINKADFVTGDFWPKISHLKRDNTRFDCVFLDPPLFSTTRHGKVDLVESSHRLLNKVRPLIADGGYLVTVNNALFVSGTAFMQTLDTLCADGYLSVETLIPVPQDYIGYSAVAPAALPSDPAPFNHATKIAVLKVRRKDAMAEFAGSPPQPCSRVPKAHPIVATAPEGEGVRLGRGVHINPNL